MRGMEPYMVRLTVADSRAKGHNSVGIFRMEAGRYKISARTFYVTLSPISVDVDPGTPRVAQSEREGRGRESERSVGGCFSVGFRPPTELSSLFRSKVDGGEGGREGGGREAMLRLARR